MGIGIQQILPISPREYAGDGWRDEYEPVGVSSTSDTHREALEDMAKHAPKGTEVIVGKNITPILNYFDGNDSQKFSGWFRHRVVIDGVALVSKK